MVLVGQVSESDRWCIARVGDDDRIESLHDKDPSLEEPFEAVVGVYWFPRTSDLQEAARRVAEEAEEKGRRRLEMSHVLMEIAKSSKLRAARVGQWLDCGNADNLSNARRELLQARAFNELKIDPVLGTITKRSRKIEKFIDEVSYLQALPRQLSVLFPRLVDCSLEGPEPWATFEYYGYPTLGEIFVFGSMPHPVWGEVFAGLHHLLTTMFVQPGHSIEEGMTEAMYLRKTRDRMNALLDDAVPEVRHLISAEGILRLNGRPVRGLLAQWPRIEAAVRGLRPPAGGIIHGDLCFGNILYDRRSHVFRLIDPRGSFGRTGIHGDVRYDVAKLYHSVRGGYDFIVSDLFRASLKGSDLSLKLFVRPEHRQILGQFERVFFESFLKAESVLISALLFASMPALHFDSPKRQLAMLGTALELFEEYFALVEGEEGAAASTGGALR